MLGTMVFAVALAVGATGGSTVPTEPTVPDGSVADGTELPRCIVRLHGAGGGGQPTMVWGGVADVMPNGNGQLTAGGLLWDYDGADDLAEAREIVEQAVAPCDAIMLDGFSNGAAFAARLYCLGENFDGRLLRVVVDDPVTDASVADCAPDPSVAVALYWTGGLAPISAPGTDCSGTEHVCLGGTMLGIDAFAEALGVEPIPSIYTDHQWHWYAPELADWSDPPTGLDVPATSVPVGSVPG
jgi:hypothetical protein